MNSHFIKIFVGGLAVILFLFKWRPQQGPLSPSIKELHLALPCLPSTLDPATTNSFYNSLLISLIYEGLVEYHYLNPYTLTPNLAEAMPTLSNNGLTYTFYIKRGIYFHDNVCFPNAQGRELIAEDVVYSFKRLADPALKAPLFKRYASIIKGMHAFHDHLKHVKRDDYNYPLEGVQAIDKYIVQFTLTEPFPFFLHYLALEAAFIVPKEAVSYYQNQFLNHPVGTGPFTLNHFNCQSNKWTFLKNKKFRNKIFPTQPLWENKETLGSPGRRLPFVDQITYHAIYKEHDLWSSFKKKEIDCINIGYNSLLENENIKKEISEKRITLVEEPNHRVSYIGFNSLRKPLDNLKLRQAISLAFDRDSYNKRFIENFGNIPHSLIPPGFIGYNKAFVNPYAHYDIQKAKKYLAEAGYPEGKGLPTITLDISTRDQEKELAIFFIKCMKKVGIKIEVQISNWTEFLKKLQKGKFMLSYIGETLDYADAATLWESFLHKGKTGFIIKNHKFNQLCRQAIRMEDSVEKSRAYEQLNEWAIELTPLLLLPTPPYYTLKHAYIKNYLIHPFNRSYPQYLDIEIE